MLNVHRRKITMTPAYAFAKALQDQGVAIDPESFALDYQRAKDVWKSVHPTDSYYRPSEFYSILIENDAA